MKHLVLLAILAFCSSCSGPLPEKATEDASSTISVTISPTSVTVPAGGQQTFTATVTNSANQAVNWSVLGVNCGTISTAGVFKAPLNQTNCRVRANAQADTKKSDTVTVAIGPPATITVSPTHADVPAGALQTFTATVGNTTNQAVSWSVLGANCGMINTAGVYKASLVQANSCSIQAVLKVDTTKSATATVTITAPVSIQISPASVAVDACQTQQFTATISGTINQGALWSVTEADGGAISPSGLYTASATAGTYHVVGKSVVDPSRSLTATVVVTERILEVSVSPTSVTVAANGTYQFTATVTTTCGAFTQTNTIAAN